MRTQRWIVTPFLALVLTATGCGRGALQPTGSDTRYRSFTGSSYATHGDEFSLIVDTRASRIAERQEFLPLLIAYVSKSDQRTRLLRESFVLETTDGTRLPAVAYREFEDDYARQNFDIRASRDFLEALNGRYPDPPFRQRDLEFYPPRGSGAAPREDIEIRNGEMAVGFLYFRLPDQDLLDESGSCRMLFTPGDEDTRYIIELQVYRAEKK
jgi:hypothetical protein